MQLSGTICPPASATGSVPGRYNRVDLLSLTPAFRNVLNSPLLSLGSTPSALSDFAQMFKEKEFFSLNECQRPGKILYKEMHKSALC